MVPKSPLISCMPSWRFTRSFCHFDMSIGAARICCPGAGTAKLVIGAPLSLAVMSSVADVVKPLIGCFECT
jgi:hypothetical protein